MRLKIRFWEKQLFLWIALSFTLTAYSDISLTNSTIQTTPTITTNTTSSPAQTYQATFSPTFPATPLPATPTLAVPTATTSIAATATQTAAPLPDGWQHDWLLGKPCPLPCWEWLQPGATNVDEAVVMLKQNPLVEAESIKFETGSLDYNYVSWKWWGQNYGGSFSYAANTESKLLKGIFIDLKGWFKLKDIIQAFGEPSHIYATGTDLIHGPGYFYGLDLIWERQGLRVPFFQGQQSPPVLTPELTAYSTDGRTPIYIVEPGDLSNFEFGGELGTIRPWQGFRPFGFYCYDIHTKKPCP
jgi:hypothetical protein